MILHESYVYVVDVIKINRQYYIYIDVRPFHSAKSFSHSVLCTVLAFASDANDWACNETEASEIIVPTDATQNTHV